MSSQAILTTIESSKHSKQFQNAASRNVLEKNIQFSLNFDVACYEVNELNSQNP